MCTFGLVFSFFNVLVILDMLDKCSLTFCGKASFLANVKSVIDTICILFIWIFLKINSCNDVNKWWCKYLSWKMIQFSNVCQKWSHRLLQRKKVDGIYLPVETSWNRDHLQNFLDSTFVLMYFLNCLAKREFSIQILGWALLPSICSPQDGLKTPISTKNCV